MIDAQAVLQLLYFFAPAYFANLSPVLIARSFKTLAVPIDGGRSLGDKRILGDHKTWRGLLAGVAGAGLVFELQRLAYWAGIGREMAMIDYTAHPLVPGLLMGLGSGVGDAVKSFFKRRIGIAPGASWLVFDQLDFFFGAYVFVSVVYVPPLLPALASLPIVFFANVAINALGYCLGFKDTWI
jgi:CDP-2,3-bis-(O-geranylgeranyl)-sn-glycerol synthase